MKTTIIGAGLAGLIAACYFKDAAIVEAGKRAPSHKALLRFRGEGVSDMTGIPFKEVRVHKEVHSDDKQHAHCAIADSNLYARKVSGAVAARSILDLRPVTRYIAPDDLYDQLADRHASRIEWETPLANINHSYEPLTQWINTAPLPVIMDICGMPPLSIAQTQHKAIRVNRYLVPCCDVYQTMYFPEQDLRVYRASITGNLLIVESIDSVDPSEVFVWRETRDEELIRVLQSFGIGDMFMDLHVLPSVSQKLGKITDLPRDQREAILYELTNTHNVFSLGRFATWRNILLDDVVSDIGKVDRLMQSSNYHRNLSIRGRK